MDISYENEEPIIQDNALLLDEIRNSEKICCFDETILLSQEGLKIASFLRKKLTSKKFFHLPGMEQALEELKNNLEKELQTIKDSEEFKQAPPSRKLVKKAAELEKRLKGVKNALSSDTLHTTAKPKGKDVVMITGDINLAEYLRQRGTKHMVYFLCFNKELRKMELCRWGDVRKTKLRETRNLLSRILADSPCWISSSALASARLARFTEALQELPRTMQEQVKVLDISAGQAKRKSVKSTSRIEKLTSLCGTQNMGMVLPSASENELLALAIYYASKDQNLLTIWNDRNQAEQVRQIVKSYDGGKQLGRVAFFQFSWFGNLEELSDFPDNELAKALCGSSAEHENIDTQNSNIKAHTIHSFAQAIGEKDVVIQVKLIKKAGAQIRNVNLGPQATLRNEDFRFLCQEVFPEKIAARYPDEQTIRTAGAVLGKQISRLSLEELNEIIGDNPAQNELAIVYARRWEMPDILEHLLEKAEILSPYCLENWFKRSQNAQQHMTLKDLMLNNAYYNFLREVVVKTPYVDSASDAITKLRLLQASAEIPEVRKRAGCILDMLEGKIVENEIQ